MATTAKKSAQVLDGSDISDLVNNKQVFSKFIDEKFQQLDQNHDGKLSVKELEPAVAEIGAALGLPAQGSSSDSDHIYSEVLNEFTHGKEKQVSKSEFQEVLSDILLGMAAGLKRDPIVILRIDGDDLIEFVNSSRFISEALVIFSEIEPEEDESLRNCITKALKKLTVDHGMPPASDSWVFNNIIEPALEANSALLNKTPISQETFLKTLKKVTESIADHLKERPVIVAHSGNTFDGSGIKRLLSNKFEADKVLDSAWKSVPKDRHGKLSREYLRVALDDIAPAAGLPPFGAVDQMDELLKGVFKMVKADEGTSLQEEEFKKGACSAGTHCKGAFTGSFCPVVDPDSTLCAVSRNTARSSVSSTSAGSQRASTKQSVKGIWGGMVSRVVVQMLILFWMIYRTNWDKEGIWGGMVSRVLVQALILLLVISRTNWDKENHKARERQKKRFTHNVDVAMQRGGWKVEGKCNGYNGGSSSHGVLGVGQMGRNGCGSVLIENSFRDCSLTGNSSSHGRGFESSYGFLDNRNSEEMEREMEEIETLQLFPMHGEETAGICPEKSSGEYFSDWYFDEEDKGACSASLELTLNSYSDGDYTRS